MDVQSLKSFDEDRLSLDEAVGLSADAGLLINEYEAQGIEVPAWLADAQRRISRYITEAQRDRIEARLAEIEAEQASLETPSEKRRRLADERKKLQERLAA